MTMAFSHIHPPKHVLVVALPFPPSAAAAAIAPARLATYLPAHGWFPTFLTMRTSRLRMPHAEGQGYPLPTEGIAVCRTNIIYPWETLRRLLPRRGAPTGTAAAAPVAPAASDSAPAQGLWIKEVIEQGLSLPDEFCGWLPFALAAGLSVARHRRVDCLYSIGPPMTGHVVGLGLHRLLGCPWVADFQDPWLANPWRRQDRRWPLQGIETRLERAVFRSATRIAANTPEMADLLSQASGRPREDFVVVPSTYDAEEVRSVAEETAPTRDKLVLIHAGHFYGPRSPAPLLHALAQVARDPELAGRVELRLLGGYNKGIDSLATQLGIADLVHQVGLVSHRETLRALLASDLAVVVQPGTSVQIPAKLYDYLGCRVPVLALTGEGATARLTREAQAGLVAPPDDVAAIAAALRTGLTQTDAVRAQMDTECLARFEAQHVVGEVAGLLDELSG